MTIEENELKIKALEDRVNLLEIFARNVAQNPSSAKKFGVE